MDDTPLYRQFLFTDLVNGKECLLVFAGDNKPVIVHGGCESGAEVFPHLDAFYCEACGYNGRISGHWVAAIGEIIHLSRHYCA